jgi:hypothetical protein
LSRQKIGRKALTQWVGRQARRKGSALLTGFLRRQDFRQISQVNAAAAFDSHNAIV